MLALGDEGEEFDLQVCITGAHKAAPQLSRVIGGEGVEFEIAARSVRNAEDTCTRFAIALHSFRHAR